MSKANELEESILKCLIKADRKKNITKIAMEIQKSKGYVDRAIEKMIQKGFVTINKDWIRADLDPRSNIIELEWKGFAYGVVKYNIEAHDYLKRNYRNLSKIQRKLFREISHIPDATQRQLTWWYSLKYWLKTGKLGGAEFDEYVVFRLKSDKRYRKGPFRAALETYKKTNPREARAEYLRYERRILKGLSRVDKAITT